MDDNKLLLSMLLAVWVSLSLLFISFLRLWVYLGLNLLTLLDDVWFVLWLSPPLFALMLLSPSSSSSSSSLLTCCSSMTSNYWFFNLKPLWVTYDTFDDVSDHSPQLLSWSMVSSCMPRKLVSSFMDSENFGGKYFTCSIVNILA